MVFSEKINSRETLQNAIQQLEAEQITNRKNLLNQLLTTYDSVKPISVITRLFEQAADSQSKEGSSMLNAGVGLAIGYLGRKWRHTKTGGPVRNMVEAAVQFGVSEVIAKNIATALSFGLALSRVIGRRNAAKLQAKETK